MLSPHTLSLLGNLAGEAGMLLPIGLVLALGLYIVNAVSQDRILGDAPATHGETAGFKKAFGALPAILMALSGRAITAVTGATVFLVTSGFVFNEVFLHWFPNFAFAFALLGALVLIHLAGHRAAQMFQILFVGIAFIGLGLLTGMGLAKTAPIPVDNDGMRLALQARPTYLFLLIFIGFDLRHICSRRPEAGTRRDLVVTTIGLMAVAILLGLWGLVSIKFVTLERLADTTIAHILVAKKVWGQTGRYLIGIVAIAGSCAAVSGLVTGISQMIRDMAHQRLLPSFGGIAEKPAATVLLLSGLIAAMMASGMAGTEEIDIYLRAGLLLWMLNYAAVHAAVIRHNSSKHTRRIFWPILGFLAMLFSTTLLIMTDPDREILLKFLVVSVFAITAIAGGGRYYLKRK